MPKPKTNEKRTDAQRATRNAANYRTSTVITCKLDRATAERYKALCAEQGTTPNAEIKAFILSQLAQAPGALAARIAAINAQPPEAITQEEAASLAAAEAMDDGTAEEINHFMDRSHR